MTVRIQRLIRSRALTSGLAAGLAAAGCGDPSGAPAPSAPAVPQPSLAVSFVEDAARLAEGETAEIPVRWSGGSPGRALRIGVTAQNQTTTDDDYELLSASFEIPQSAASGTAVVSLRALEDEMFAEGDETLSLQLVAPSGAAVQVGGNLGISIEEAGVSPCAGIRIGAEPPSRQDSWEEGATLQPSETARTRFIVVSGPGSEAVALDWIGPYRDYDLSSWNPSFRRRTVNSSTLFHVILENWSFDMEESTLRHEIQVEWLAELEVGLRFRSADGACAGEPVAACTGGGCELRP
jgi:hypothetical protein